MDEGSCFNVNPLLLLNDILSENEKVSCMAGSTRELYLGTTRGRMIHFTEKEKTLRKRGILDMPAGTPITQLEDASAIDLLLVLCDRSLHFLSLNDFRDNGRRPNVFAFGVNSNPLLDDPFSLKLALATPAEVLVCTKGPGTNIHTDYKIKVTDPAIAVAYSRNIVCYATVKQYYVFNLISKVNLPLFPIEQGIAACICNIETDLFLMAGMDGLGIFVSGDGMSTRPPLMLPSKSTCSLLYQHPYIFHQASGILHVVSSEDSRQVYNMQSQLGRVDSVALLAGTILVASDSSIVIVAKQPVENQIEELIATKNYEKAIRLATDSLSGTYDEVKWLGLQFLKKRIGILELSENNFEHAASVLQESDISPLELIEMFDVDGTKNEQLYKSSDHLTFLFEFLTRLKNEREDFADSQLVDTTLFKLSVSNGAIMSSQDIGNLNPVLEDCYDFLKKKAMLKELADFALANDDFDTVLSIWKEHFGDNDFVDVQELADVLLRTTGSVLRDTLEWVLPLNKQCGRKVILTHKEMRQPSMMSYVCNLLKEDPEILLEYLQLLPLDYTMKQRIEVTLQLLDNNESSDLHLKIRPLLVQLKKEDVELLRAKFQPVEKFRIEHLLLDSQENAKEALEAVLSLEELSAAELICRYTSFNKSTLYLILLKHYLKMGKCDEQVLERIAMLVNDIPRNTDSQQILEQLPDNMALNKVTPFVAHAVLTANHVSSTQNLRGAILQKCVKEQKTPVVQGPKVIIEDDSPCPVCQRLLSYDKPLTILSTGYIIHSACMRHPNICPVTNTVFR